MADLNLLLGRHLDQGAGAEQVSGSGRMQVQGAVCGPGLDEELSAERDVDVEGADLGDVEGVSSATTYEGTLATVTETAFPPRTWARAVMVPRRRRW